ncbi:hypothetical protein [Clostridium botulinum]|nr:hypothetical protein [Clostridium botulinum]
MKELKISEVKTIYEKIDEFEMEEVELLEQKNEFWCLVNACGWNK